MWISRPARILVVASLVSPGCETDPDCPQLNTLEISAPRAGAACDAEGHAACAEDPQADPWVYTCRAGALVFEGTGHSGDWQRCIRDRDGNVGITSHIADQKAGGCHRPEEELAGPLSGTPCPLEGATTCAPDPATDPWFYVCAAGRLEVLDHETFHGAARCEVARDGQVRVRYTAFMPAQ